MSEDILAFPRDVAASAPVDIAVIGAGVVGLALAIALAQAGFAVASVGPVSREQNGRTVALLDGSVSLLDTIGIWARAAPFAAPLRTMRIVDDTGSPFRGPPVDFVAAELGLPAFGSNIENAILLGLLEDAAAVTPGLTRHPTLFETLRRGPSGVEVDLADGGRVTAQVLIAADGARSKARDAAGIGAKVHRYPQVALTTMLDHTRPHGDVSTEFHTRQGPFTLVPLVADSEAPHRSSLVWVMAPDEADRRAALDGDGLAREIEGTSRLLLGGVRVRGAVGRFPIVRLTAERLVAERFVLAGEAAHALPPIGAQGLNLSLRDVRCLVEVLGEAQASGRDLGAPGVLTRYDEARRGDIALRGAGVHALNAALLSRHLPLDALRGAGLAALRLVGPLRHAVMRQGLSPERRPIANLRLAKPTKFG